jgi:PhnB protein
MKPDQEELMMPDIKLTPYIFFDGRCADAFTFYHDVFGGELKLQKYGDVPADQMPRPDGMDDKVLHALLASDDAHLMGADSVDPKSGNRISLSLGGADEAKLRGYFDKLSDGGQVGMPLEPMFWGDTYGSVVDRFGIEWMVNIEGKKD